MKEKLDDYNAGEFRNLVLIQRPEYTDDGAGGQTTAWKNLCKVWCRVQEKQSDEKYGDDSTAGRVITKNTWEFVTWWRKDKAIVETCRLSYKGKFWNISCVENIKDLNKFLRITATAGVEQ